MSLPLVPAFQTLLNLSVAFALGSTIGLERQYRQRTAGLRTNALVAVGAAAFVDLGQRLDGSQGASHIVAYVVSGVGFLGAGAIMREEGNVRGLNTAATLWGSAAVGACAGTGLIIEALLATCFVLAANTLLRPVVNAINRKPVDGAGTEATYEVVVIASDTSQQEARELLDRELEAMAMPARDMQVESFGSDEVQISATLLPTSLNPSELDQLVLRLQSQAHIRQAFWNSSTGE